MLMTRTLFQAKANPNDDNAVYSPFVKHLSGSNQEKERFSLRPKLRWQRTGNFTLLDMRWGLVFLSQFDNNQGH